jgi:hypothetical protein
VVNATETLLAISQLGGIGFAVKISRYYNYLFGLDLISGRPDLSRGEAHHDVPPSSLGIVFRSSSRLWQSQIVTGRAEGLMTQACRPGDFPTSVGRNNARERHGCSGARARILRSAHGHRRRAPDYDRGLGTALSSYGSQEEYPRCVITAWILHRLDLQGLAIS